MKKHVLTTVLACMICAAPVLALGQFPHQNVTEEKILSLADSARQNLGSAKLPDGKPINETPSEQGRPLLPKEMQRRVVEFGALMAMKSACGLDWKPEAGKFLDAEENSKRWTPKQMAYMEILVRMSIGVYQMEISRSTGCTTPMKRYVG